MTPELILAFIFGCVFVGVLLVIAVTIPNPTTQQMFIFRVVLALSAAGIGAVFPGFLDLQGKVLEISLRAGGALAMFILVYLINPPASLNRTLAPKSEGQQRGRKVSPATSEQAQSNIPIQQIVNGNQNATSVHGDANVTIESSEDM